MNTKGMKFLAVLAVLAMAFAAFAIVAPADNSDAAEVAIDGSDITTSKALTGGGKADFINLTTAGADVELTISGATGANALYVYAGAGNTYTLKLPAGFGDSLSIYLTTTTELPTTSKVNKVDGIVIAGTASAVYTIDSVAGTVTTAQNSDTGSTYGAKYIAAGASAVYKYFKQGADLGTITLGYNETVTGQLFTTNATAIVKQVIGTGSAQTTNQLTLNKFVTTEPISIVATTAEKTTLSIGLDKDKFTSGSLTVNSGNFALGSTTLNVKDVSQFNFVAMGDDTGYLYVADAASTIMGIVDGDHPIQFVIAGTPVKQEDSFTITTDTGEPQIWFKSATIMGLTMTVTTTSADPNVTVTHKIGASGANAKITKLNQQQAVIDSVYGINGDACWKQALTGTLTLKSGNYEIPTAGLQIGYYAANATDAVNEANKGKLNVSEGATLDIKGNAATTTPTQTLSIAKGSELAIFGTISSGDLVRNIGAATVPESSEGKFSAYGNALITQNVYILVDDINVEGASKDVYISNDIVSDIVWKQYQTVNVVGDVTILPGVTASILGTLNIDSGVTFTVANKSEVYIGSIKGEGIFTSAKVNNEGTIDIIDGGKFSVDAGTAGYLVSPGDIDVAGQFIAKATFELTEDAFMDVSSSGQISGTGLVVGADAQLDIDGTIVDDTVIGIKGTANINGIVADDLTVNMKANGAIFNVNSAKTGSAGAAITVSDNGLKITKNVSVGGEEVKANQVTVTLASKDDVLTGLKITESAGSTKSGDDTYYYAKMDLSSAPSAEVAGDDAEITAGDGTTESNFTVATSFAVGKDVKFTIAQESKLSVSGDMYYTASDAVMDNNGEITVTGMITSKTNSADVMGTINAAMYSEDVAGTKTYYYTTLTAAITYGATKISICGTTNVSADTVIPAGVTVDATGATVNVGSTSDRSVTMTIADGATVKNGTYNVYGTLLVENKSTGLKSATVNSDVSSTGLVSVKYTNVYSALASASVGDVVKITKTEPVIIEQNTTIPVGVTLEVPASSTLSVANGNVLTVNGVLDSWNAVGGTFATTESSDAAKIVVNGTFMSTDDVKYSNYKIPGAYFSVTGTSPYQCVAPVEVAALIIDDIDDRQITIEGVVSVGDVYIDGDDDGAEVIIGSTAQVTAGTITLDNAKVTSAKDNKETSFFTGTIANDGASVKITGEAGFTIVDDSDKLKMTSDIVKSDAFTGTNSTSIAKGTVYAKDAIKAAKLTVASGATLVIDGNGNSLNLSGDFTVAGDVEVSDVGSATFKDLLLTGTFTVVPADATKGTGAGSATTTGTTYVGFSKASDAYKAPTAASAILYAESISGLKTVFLLAGSAVSPALVENMKCSTFSVDGAEYMAVYVSAEGLVMASGVQSPEIQNGVFTNWTYTSGGEVVDVTAEKDVDVYKEKAFAAKINYNIYNVSIVSDNGIKSISIDNVLMSNTSGGNTFTMNGLKAGVHKVAYSLYNGYEGEATLLTSMGTVLPNLSFTLSGNPETGTVVNESYQLTGTHQIVVPEPEPTPTPEKESEWTITTILLVVLVVLIAIMAVLVALKLNRS